MQKIRGFWLKHAPRAAAFDVAWRLAVLALPWQTRWYREATLAGWPWEQGSWAVYASWFLVAATILLAYRPDGLRGVRLSRADKVFLWLAAAAIGLSNLVSASYPASIQWLGEVGLLGGFGWALRRKKVPAKSLAAWFAIALIPQALLAYWQYAVQRVDAVKWLGIAFQSPKQLGVSVVEFADLRYLRAYGGMPHPNILGGWLVLGCLTAWQAAWQAAKKSTALAWSAVSAGLAGALVLTFSRSAYLALAAGLAGLVLMFVIRRKDERTSLQFGGLALLVSVAFAGVLAFAQRDVLLARADAANRLVVQATDARLQGYADGWRSLKAKPLFGLGPNAESAGLWQSVSKEDAKKPRQPLESPHNVFMLLAVDFGILGGLLAVWLVWRFRRAFARRWWLWPPLFILASFDHYLWSYWSGLALLASWVMLAGQPPPAEPSTSSAGLTGRTVSS